VPLPDFWPYNVDLVSKGNGRRVPSLRPVTRDVLLQRWCTVRGLRCHVAMLWRGEELQGPLPCCKKRSANRQLREKLGSANFSCWPNGPGETIYTPRRDTTVSRSSKQLQGWAAQLQWRVIGSSLTSWWRKRNAGGCVLARSESFKQTRQTVFLSKLSFTLW